MGLGAREWACISKVLSSFLLYHFLRKTGINTTNKYSHYWTNLYATVTNKINKYSSCTASLPISAPVFLCFHSQLESSLTPLFSFPQRYLYHHVLPPASHLLAQTSIIPCILLSSSGLPPMWQPMKSSWDKKRKMPLLSQLRGVLDFYWKIIGEWISNSENVLGI